MRWIAWVPAALLALGVLAGCGGTSAGSTPQQQHQTSHASPSQQKTISVTVAHGTITPAPGRISVAAGTEVTVEVTDDSADEVHVHGYDLEKAVSPGHPVRITFVADQTGLFEVETHKLDTLLFQLEVR